MQLRPVTPLYVFAQIVHIIFRVAEDDGQHEFALRVILEGKICELEVFERFLVEQVDDPPAVN
ncbi:MAG: hypothetical protein A2937_03530 [Candidatus Yonathbacteria bacterium RIFCSPLOWO2_01_FULL_47_33b]|uniref:Uncharacterized protein n=1 Tax=Candidatus Yonathbacteria bacterium RIFCSPLOWO2_01_FULL_47_33b TaxID=1802727 RepID=A0A1G2SED0_9BACT|nr:MAG: hypothetical protein A2937_03530 [Candidatus Yonathbacteria bacterium RIFCSPLOWO2_01_FULL_47_33b]